MSAVFVDTVGNTNFSTVCVNNDRLETYDCSQQNYYTTSEHDKTKKNLEFDIFQKIPVALFYTLLPDQDADTEENEFLLGEDNKCGTCPINVYDTLNWKNERVTLQSLAKVYGEVKAAKDDGIGLDYGIQSHPLDRYILSKLTNDSDNKPRFASLGLWIEAIDYFVNQEV